MRSLLAGVLAVLLATLQAPAEGLDGKVMCGYQGWFRTPRDGTNNGWHHYTTSGAFKPGQCAIDLWPDVSELPHEEQYPTAFTNPDGSAARVFSSVNPGTVALHFQWMKEYGIDGIFLQRFAVTTRDPRFRDPMDTVLLHCRKAARDTGRSWALMYDLSGCKPGETDAVIADWKRLRTRYRVAHAATDPAYLVHRGKPLIALWGLGFSDRPPMLDAWKRLLAFFRDDPDFGGCAIMVGVPAYWRSLDRDAIPDKTLHDILATVDVISPWTVGRYDSPEAAARFAGDVLAPDLAWCEHHAVDYLPVAFPGFSWHNLSKSRGKSAPLNAIPRREGRFFWSQCRNFHAQGARMLYVAMFDELDEATAIFKFQREPPVGASRFISETTVPNDHYLRLTGAAGKLFRGEEPPPAPVFPAREAPQP